MKRICLLLALVGLATVSAKDKEARLPDPDKDKVLVLEPLKIEGKPIFSFAFDLTLYADPKTKKVTHLFITHVLPNTDAEDAGLRPGDEIVKIGGVPVTQMDSRVAVDSELGRIFLNREPGQPTNFEILVRRPQKFTLRAQRGSIADRLR